MGLTPLEGLVGGTRAGSLDPSLIFHLYKDPREAGALTDVGGLNITNAEVYFNKQAGVRARRASHLTR